MGHRGVDFSNDARDFIARNEWQRRFDLVEPCDHEGIDVTETRGFDIDDDLAGLKFGFRDVLNL